jgi:5'-deoxynucleotidase YfbR-like HD superfamily hydrolase
VYVNLKRYTSPERGRETDWVPQAAANDDLAVLKTVLDPSNTHPVIILLDGIDEYVRYDAAVENQVLDLAEQCSSAKQIVGVGLNYLGNREKFKRSLPKLDNPEAKLTLEAIPLRDIAAVSSAVSAFAVTYPDTITPDPVRSIIERANLFRLREIDMLLLSMLFDSIKSSRYAHAGTLSDFFTLYCEQVLQTDSGNESLVEAAQIAFEYAIKPGPYALDKHVHRRSWKLLHTHVSIKDFLVAWHAVDLVRAAARATDAAQLTDLNYVYPHTVNRFCKDIVNSDRDLQFDVLEGAKRIFREGGENARPHACYLAGRLSDGAAREEAADWLRSVCMPKVEELQAMEDSKLRPSELLLCRTVYISLACLNDEAASEAYVRLLLDRPEWNNINRGFHLEYYGDMPFDPERQLSHSDRLGAFTHAYESLRERIGSNLNNSGYGLFNVEVFTLYSLAQYRHMKGSQLDSGTRQELLGLIPELLNSSNLSATVRDYLRMLQVNFADERPFTPGRLAEKLYGLKEEERGGWKERNLPLKRIESVADHTTGAFMLGLAYLPELRPKNWPDYDKNIVLLYVMIHDLAESISGDVTLRNSNEETRAKERAAFRYLMMCKTYPRIANLEVYYQMWEEFESKANENARIAKDLDKLENLMQLILYRRQASIPDYLEWKSQLINDVTTSAGRHVLRILQEHFELDTGPAIA